eukprot:TCONS_00073760-protein
MESGKPIKMESEDIGYEETIFQQTNPFNIKIEFEDTVPLPTNAVSENLNELDKIKVEFDYSFLINKDNFLLDIKPSDIGYDCKPKNVDPRIKPCFVLVERCKIPLNTVPSQKSGASSISNKCHVCGKIITHGNLSACSRKCILKWANDMYMLIKNNRRPIFECEQCDKDYMSKSSLVRHNRTVHENSKQNTNRNKRDKSLNKGYRPHNTTHHYKHYSTYRSKRNGLVIQKRCSCCH